MGGPSSDFSETFRGRKPYGFSSWKDRGESGDKSGRNDIDDDGFQPGPIEDHPCERPLRKAEPARQVDRRRDPETQDNAEDGASGSHEGSLVQHDRQDVPLLRAYGAEGAPLPHTLDHDAVHRVGEDEEGDEEDDGPDDREETGKYRI